MELKDLSSEERLALVALVELVVDSNARVSEPEAQHIEGVVSAIGEESYNAAAEEVDQRFPDEAELRKFLGSITRQEARELIYTTVMDTAFADVVDGHEAELLEWLAGVWKV